MVAPTVSVLLTLQFTEYFSSLLEARSETNPVNSLVAEVTKIYVVTYSILRNYYQNSRSILPYVSQ